MSAAGTTAVSGCTVGVDLLRWTFTGVAGATATVLATTLDDCVWLVPYVVQTANRTVAWQHALIFAVTLVSFTASVTLATLFLQEGVHRATPNVNFDLLWGCVGAALCWSLAGYFYFRSWMKKKRRQQQAAERLSRSEDKENLVDALNTSSTYGTGSIVGEPDAALTTFQPWVVITLTIMGALDEVSYFPAVIVGKVFTVTELVLGTLLTVVIILFVVVRFLSMCKPLLNFLDRIPLYAVVTLFALLLTGEVIWEVVPGNDTDR